MIIKPITVGFSISKHTRNQNMEDFEMIDIVHQTLESEGILHSIKAQLRASVYFILMKNKPKRENVKLDEFSGNIHGSYLISLVYDLLDNLNLKQTLSVYEAEVGQMRIPRDVLYKDLKIQPKDNEPLLLGILSGYLNKDLKQPEDLITNKPLTKIGNNTRNLVREDEKAATLIRNSDYEEIDEDLLLSTDGTEPKKSGGFGGEPDTAKDSVYNDSYDFSEDFSSKSNKHDVDTTTSAPTSTKSERPSSHISDLPSLPGLIGGSRRGVGAISSFTSDVEHSSKEPQRKKAMDDLDDILRDAGDDEDEEDLEISYGLAPPHPGSRDVEDLDTTFDHDGSGEGYDEGAEARVGEGGADRLHQNEEKEEEDDEYDFGAETQEISSKASAGRDTNPNETTGKSTFFDSAASSHPRQTVTPSPALAMDEKPLGRDRAQAAKSPLQEESFEDSDAIVGESFDESSSFSKSASVSASMSMSVGDLLDQAYHSDTAFGTLKGKPSGAKANKLEPIGEKSGLGVLGASRGLDPLHESFDSSTSEGGLSGGSQRSRASNRLAPMDSQARHLDSLPPIGSLRLKSPRTDEDPFVKSLNQRDADVDDLFADETTADKGTNKEKAGIKDTAIDDLEDPSSASFDEATPFVDVSDSNPAANRLGFADSLGFSAVPRSDKASNDQDDAIFVKQTGARDDDDDGHRSFENTSLHRSNQEDEDEEDSYNFSSNLQKPSKRLGDAYDLDSKGSTMQRSPRPGDGDGEEGDVYGDEDFEDFNDGDQELESLDEEIEEELLSVGGSEGSDGGDDVFGKQPPTSSKPESDGRDDTAPALFGMARTSSGRLPGLGSVGGGGSREQKREADSENPFLKRAADDEDEEGDRDLVRTEDDNSAGLGFGNIILRKSDSPRDASYDRGFRGGSDEDSRSNSGDEMSVGGPENDDEDEDDVFKTETFKSTASNSKDLFAKKIIGTSSTTATAVSGTRKQSAWEIANESLNQSDDGFGLNDDKSSEDEMSVGGGQDSDSNDAFGSSLSADRPGARDTDSYEFSVSEHEVSSSANLDVFDYATNAMPPVKPRFGF